MLDSDKNTNKINSIPERNIYGTGKNLEYGRPRRIEWEQIPEI